MAAELDIQIEQGATFELLLTWTDEAGLPIDTTGYEAALQMRTRQTDTAEILLNLRSPGEITLGGVDGTITVRAEGNLTVDVERDGYYDLFLWKTNDPTDRARLLAGKAIVARRVTVA